MPRCTACDAPDRAALDRSLAIGAEAISTLARRHKLSRQAILRHREAHLPKALTEAVALATEDRGGALIAEIDGLKDRLSSLLTRAESKGDLRGAATIIREGARLLELIAKLRGDLTPPPAVSITVVQTPEFQAVASRILVALDGYPAARAAVVAALAGGGR